VSPYWQSVLCWVPILCVPLTAELLAVFWPGCPWNTLSWTIWQTSSRWGIFALLVAGALFVGIIHFAFAHWPSRKAFPREYDEK